MLEDWTSVETKTKLTLKPPMKKEIKVKKKNRHPLKSSGSFHKSVWCIVLRFQTATMLRIAAKTVLTSHTSPWPQVSKILFLLHFLCIYKKGFSVFFLFRIGKKMVQHSIYIIRFISVYSKMKATKVDKHIKLFFSNTLTFLVLE